MKMKLDLSFFKCCILLVVAFSVLQNSVLADPNTSEIYSRTKASADKFQKTSLAISKVLTADLKRADPQTLLIPDHFFNGTDKYGRVNKNRYSPHNSGADHYPHLIITASIVDPSIYYGRMMEMLRNEIRYTNVKDGVPGTYNLNNHTVGKMSLFGGGEWMKDGAIPVTEFLGRTPWFDRMLEIAAGVMKNSEAKSNFGRLPTDDSELNGDMLQVFSRVVPMTADPKMLEWSRRISDAYINEAVPGTFGLVPTKWNFVKHQGNHKLRLRDHGNETLVGLVLMAAIEQALHSDRAEKYITVVRTMLDRMLESANPDGLLFNVIDAETLQPETQELADNWGYVYGAVYSFYMMTGEQKYRDACLKVLSNISKYKGYPWEGEHYDGIADSVESALYLLAREPNDSAFDFVEFEIARMLAMQMPNGHIDESYLEGNFNRTAIMYMMYKSQGILPVGWTPGIGIGAEKEGNNLRFTISAAKVAGKKPEKSQRIKFDSERHRRYLNYPKNFPRVNEFPEWYVVQENQLYELKKQGAKESLVRLGSELIQGLDLEIGDWEIKPFKQPLPADVADKKQEPKVVRSLHRKTDSTNPSIVVNPTPIEVEKNQ